MRQFFSVKTGPLRKPKISIQFDWYIKVRAPREKFRRTSHTTQFRAPLDLTRHTCSPYRIICHEPNEIGYTKINIEINSGTAVSSFFSFSDSIVTT